MAGNQVAIVVPVLREAGNIRRLTDELASALEGYDWEVIFVDDDSDDGTFEIVREMSRTNPLVRGVLRVGDRGLATAAVAGMLTAHADYLVVMDGDGQHRAATIRDLLGPLISGDADIVSAARRLDAVHEHALSVGRTMLSRIANRVAGAFTRRDMTDPMTGYFAITSNAFQSTVRRLGDAGFKLLLDILICGPELRVREVSFEFKSRAYGDSKLDGRNVWLLLTFLASRLTGNVIPQRFVSFLAVGGLGLAVHFCILYLLLELNAGFATSQVSATVVTTVFNYLLNNLLTFSDRKLRGASLLIGLVKYFLISSVGIVANVAVATQVEATLVGYFAISALAGIAIDTVWKFFMSGLLVWTRK